MKYYIFCTCFFLFSLYADPISTTFEDQEIEINLKDPVFTQGVIKTDKGGIISTPEIRIQAEHIEYTNRVENGILVKKVVAEGDLLFQRGMYAFTGKKLEYDFAKKTGTLWDARTFTSIWFIGGDKIELNADGTYSIYDAFITTSESQDVTWDIRARGVKVTKDHLLAAKNIHFRFIKLPIFWIPSFKMNMKFLSDPPVRYKIKWDKGLGPRASMRYRVFSWEDFNLFFRLDYRLSRGLGGAVESEFYSPDERTVFLTKNYGARDKTIPDEKGPTRYRFQGLYEWKNPQDTTHIYSSYDKMSDDKMPSDFKSEDFEINTQKRTIFRLDHREENSLSSLTVQPRINFFQSINQQLPLAKVTMRPFNIGGSGIISENYASAGYLNYFYNRNLKDILHHTQSGRLEARSSLYRPVPFSKFTLTPNVGFLGIFYSRSPEQHALGQAILTYGFDASSRMFRSYNHHKHMIEPYVKFIGLSRPTTNVNDYYVFGIDDGVVKLNMTRIGLRNVFYSSTQSPFLPQFALDIFTYGFFGETAFNRTFPKYYTHLTWNRPFFAVKGGVAWNQQEKLFDYCNLLTEFTINEHFAFAFEMRHRSRFDWRKADHENFIMDVARPIDQLEHSPISDGRNTFLSRLQVRLSPKWTCNFESHTGWGRRNEPFYNEYRIQFFNVIATSWLLRVSLRKTPDDIEFVPSLSIYK